MSKSKYKSENLIIDTAGKEYFRGEYGVMWGVYDGWVQCQNVHVKGSERLIETIFLNCQTKEVIQLPEEENIFFGQYRGKKQIIFMSYDKSKKLLTGLWDVMRARPLLSAAYTDVFHVPNSTDIYAVIDKKNHLQHRGEGDKLIQDFGAITDRYYVVEDERPSLVVHKKENKQNRCYCIDLQTGKKHGPEFICMGELWEGIRHVRLLDGKDYMVDRDWNILYELPLAVYIGGGGLERTESEVRCRDGLISIMGEKTSCLINRDGEIIIKPRKHRYIHNVGASSLLVSKGNHLALADVDGSPKTDFIYKSADILKDSGSIDCCDYAFSENRLFVIKKEGRLLKFGCLDSDGNECIPFIYDLANAPLMFSKGFASVVYDN